MALWSTSSPSPPSSRRPDPGVYHARAQAASRLSTERAFDGGCPQADKPPVQPAAPRASWTAGDGGTGPPPGGPEVPMMINEAHISLSGYVATQPALRWTRTGVPALNMRVAWTPRRMDRVTGEWIDA